MLRDLEYVTNRVQSSGICNTQSIELKREQHPEHWSQECVMYIALAQECITYREPGLGVQKAQSTGPRNM